MLALQTLADEGVEDIGLLYVVSEETDHSGMIKANELGAVVPSESSLLLSPGSGHNWAQCTLTRQAQLVGAVRCKAHRRFRGCSKGY